MKAAGFTLVEVLIALVVFGFVLAGIAQGMDFGFRAWDAQARIISGRADMDAVARVLRGLVARMDPGSTASPPAVRGDAVQFAFTTDLPAAAGEGQRHADVVLSVDSDHRLTMRWTLHRHGVALAGPPSWSAASLLGGVGALRFSYLYPQDSSGAGWTGIWAEAYLPRLVRIHLEFPDGDLRHWPDIVAEPAQDRPRD